MEYRARLVHIETGLDAQRMEFSNSDEAKAFAKLADLQKTYEDIPQFVWKLFRLSDDDEETEIFPQ